MRRSACLDPEQRRADDTLIVAGRPLRLRTSNKLRAGESAPADDGAGERLRKASWMSSRISQRIRSPRNQCGKAMDCSMTQRCTPSLEPCSVLRRAMTGVIPAFRTCLRYLSWS